MAGDRSYSFIFIHIQRFAHPKRCLAPLFEVLPLALRLIEATLKL